jgi:septal ring-binding cell division protein DamX
MKQLAIFTMAALLLTGCGAEPTESAGESALPEQTATESATPSTAPETPEASEAVEAVEADSIDTDAAAETQGEDSGPASPSPSATASATPTRTASPTATATATPTASPSATAEPGFTLAEVAARNTASECWVAISGNVYDLTAWIDEHPGRAPAIIQLCGTDGTRAFTSQHGGQAAPASALARFFIGPLR